MEKNTKETAINRQYIDERFDLIAKAREYANSVVDENIKKYCGEDIYNDHLGYATQLFIAGHQSRDEEVKQLREALTELIGDAERLLQKPLKISSVDSFRENSIVKAKQLLKGI